MDRQVIEQKLESLRRCLVRIREKTLAGMAVFGSELAERMRKAVGFRNIAIHNYGVIDWEITHLIATRHLSDFSAFAAAILKFMDHQQGTPE